MVSMQQIWFCQFLRAEKLKMKAPADSGSSEGPVSSSWSVFLHCLCVMVGDKAASWGLFL